MNDWFETIVKIFLIVMLIVIIASIPVGFYLEFKIIEMSKAGEPLPWWAVWLLLNQ